MPNTVNDDAALIEGSPVPHGAPMPGTNDAPPPNKETTPPDVKMVEVEVGGQKVKVPEVFVAQYQQMSADVAELSQRVQQLSKPAAQDPSPDDPFADIEVRLFSDPKGAVKQIVDHAVKQAAGVAAASQSASEARKEFWSEFYRSHPDLDREAHGPVVDAVFARELSGMQNVSVSKAISILGDKVKAQVLKITEKAGKGAAPKRPTSEAGNEPSGSRSKPVNESASAHQPQTMSDYIRQKRAARMKAAVKSS